MSDSTLLIHCHIELNEDEMVALTSAHNAGGASYDAECEKIARRALSSAQRVEYVAGEEI